MLTLKSIIFPWKYKQFFYNISYVCYRGIKNTEYFQVLKISQNQPLEKGNPVKYENEPCNVETASLSTLDYTTESSQKVVLLRNKITVENQNLNVGGFWL